MDGFLVVTRLGQYGALLSLFGLLAFAAWAPETPAPQSSILRGLAHGGLLASILYLIALCISVCGGVQEGLSLSGVTTVLTGLAAGWALIPRLVALKIAAVTVGRGGRAALVASGLALASLAFGGHAFSGTGMLKWLRLAADLLHLGAAALWIGALCALLALCRPRGRVKLAAGALTRFSGLGTVLVAVLVATGLFNAWTLSGWPPLASPWVAALAVKLALFAGMLLLASLNRFWLAPALARDGGERALRRLRFSLWTETALAFGVVAVVSLLGTLAPRG